MPDGGTLLMITAVFGASLLQAATGIGYGVIAGPVLLVVLNGAEAFQISTIHNLLIALMLAPFVFRRTDRFALRHILAGSAIGIPVGFGMQMAVGVVALKLVSVAAVGFVTAALVSDMLRSRASGRPAAGRLETRAVGVAAGLMGGMLAMPGPLASTWMSVRGWNKAEIRATTLSFFVFAYGSGLVLYALFTGFSVPTLQLAGALAPVVLTGILVGNRITALVTEGAFRLILLAVLLATICSLVASVL